MTIGQKTGDLTVNTTGTVNDSHSDVQATYDWLQGAVTLENGEFEEGDRYVIDQGDVNDGMIITFNADGSTSVQTIGNTTMSNYEALGSLSALQWRHEMNDLNKRMGDLRDNPGAVGSWARVYGSEQEYGNVTGKNVSVQVGADYQLGDWKVGAAFAYTDGSSDFDGGDADNDAYSIGVYGTWLADNGLSTTTPTACRPNWAGASIRAATASSNRRPSSPTAASTVTRSAPETSVSNKETLTRWLGVSACASARNSPTTAAISISASREPMISKAITTIP